MKQAFAITLIGCVALALLLFASHIAVPNLDDRIKIEIEKPAVKNGRLYGDFKIFRSTVPERCTWEIHLEGATCKSDPNLAESSRYDYEIYRVPSGGSCPGDAADQPKYGLRLIATSSLTGVIDLKSLHLSNGTSRIRYRAHIYLANDDTVMSPSSKVFFSPWMNVD